MTENRSTICPTCGNSFIKRNNSNRYCSKPCRDKDYRKNNKEQIRATAERYTSKPGYKEKRTQVARNSRINNLEKHLIRAARNRVQKFGGICTLSVEDVIIPTHCPILGLELVVSQGDPGGKPNSPSLDKIVPELGYIPGNVQVISFQANMMKSNATKEQLLLFAKWIENTYAEK